MGRDQRTVTPAIRKALIARDKGCAFPCCGCAAAYTDAHHIAWWRDGGGTSLTNMVLLCRRHHRYIHHKGWTVSISGSDAQTGLAHVVDGHPWFLAPGGTTWLRSHARRTMTSDLAAA